MKALNRRIAGELDDEYDTLRPIADLVSRLTETPRNWVTTSLPPFSVGKLKKDRVVYRCEKAGCDFFERYPTAFQNSLSIERESIKARLLPIKRSPTFIIGKEDESYTLVEMYMSLCTTLLRGAFIEEFNGIQGVLVAAGGPAIPVDHPLLYFGSHFITITQFSDRRGDGWFASNAASGVIDFAGFDNKMPALAKKLYEETGFSGFGRNELDLQIRTYCEFLMRAAFFETVKETANAFLYRVIALDMLLGSGSESGMTKEVSTRAGVITAHAYGMAFDEAVKQVRDLYKWRSKFVHEGKLPPEAKIEVLRRVNEAVLFALLRVRRLQVAHAGSEITTWRKGLDFIATGLEVGRTFESDDLARAGLK